MKAIAYSIKPGEKELLTLANGKRHDLTLISNELNERTVSYAVGKDAVIVSNLDILDSRLLRELQNGGVSKIITRSRETTHIDLNEAAILKFKIANAPAPDQSLESIAQQTIRHLNLWDQGKCVGAACCCQKECADELKKIKLES